MRKVAPLLILALLMVAGGSRLNVHGAGSVSAAPAASVAALNAGCYLATPSVCKLRVDPFTVEIPAGARLEAFRLQANGQTVYDFSTDASNPPVVSYNPSRVKLDFAATCGREYVVSILVDDTSQADFTTAAQTAIFRCPEGVSSIVIYLPLVLR